MWKVNPFKYSRRPASEVKVGTVKLGSDYPVRVQSMANTDTNDIENSVAQCIRIVEAGADIVRFTTQGIREAESVKLIHNAIREKGYNTPYSVGFAIQLLKKKQFDFEREYFKL